MRTIPSLWQADGPDRFNQHGPSLSEDRFPVLGLALRRIRPLGSLSGPKTLAQRFSCHLQTQECRRAAPQSHGPSAGPPVGWTGSMSNEISRY